MENVNTIGKDFNLKQLAKFVAAPVITRLFVSILQTMDDSLFISRYCSENALAAFTVAMPWFMIIDAIGMLCSSVSISCSIKLGEKQNEEAKSDFTTMCIVTLICGLFITLILSLFLEPILKLLGETDVLMPYVKTYMNVSRFYAPLSLLNYVTSQFYVIAGKPKCSMYTTIIQIFCNLFFDWLLIAKLRIGIVGAAYANLAGFSALAIFAFVFYSNKNREIHFVKPQSEIKPLFKEVFRLGKPQVITSLSISFSSYLSNIINLDLGGEMLVAASTIVNNVQFMFMNSMFALIGTTSPIISYAYGEKNDKKLAKTFKQTAILVTILIGIIALAYIGGKDIILNLYLTESGKDDIRQLAIFGMKVAPIFFLFFGYNVLAQSFFNSVSNSKISTTLSVIENIILNNLTTLLLPRLFGINAVWFTFGVAELFTFGFSLFALYKNKDVYGLGKDGIATFAH